MWSLATFALGASLGAIGWAVTKLLFEPLKELIDLRREAQECLIMFGDLKKDATTEERGVAAQAFRRVGAGLVSRHIAAYPWVKWCIARFFPDIDIHSAGVFLLGFANATQFEGFSHVSIAAAMLRQCLRLPTPIQAPMLRALMENLARPAPIEVD
jgi:hypothetical protein